MADKVYKNDGAACRCFIAIFEKSEEGFLIPPPIRARVNANGNVWRGSRVWLTSRDREFHKSIRLQEIIWLPVGSLCGISSTYEPQQNTLTVTPDELQVGSFYVTKVPHSILKQKGSLHEKWTSPTLNTENVSNCSANEIPMAQLVESLFKWEHPQEQ